MSEGSSFGKAFGAVMGASTAAIVVLLVLVALFCGGPTLLCGGWFSGMMVLVSSQPQP